MDPNQYQTGGSYSGEYGQQPYDDLNNTLLMHPEEIMEDPAWYNEFDYSDQPWDAAGPSTEHYADGGDYYAGDNGAAAGSSDKGKGKAKDHHKSSKDKDKGKAKAKETEYRFKDDLPNPADWDCYRETIKDLYLTQKLSLRDVMEVMKETHSFAAT